MPLTPIEAIGTTVVGTAAAVSTFGGQSGKFAGLMKNKLRSMQQSLAAQPAQNSTQISSPPSQGGPPVGQLRQSLNAQLQQIHTRLTADAAQNGLTLNSGIKLEVDSSGMSHVSGSTQDQAAIESLIASDQQLDSLIASAADKARQLQAVQSAKGSSGQFSFQAFQNSLAGLSSPAASVQISLDPRHSTITASTGS
jgi:hypothetical protein